METKSVVPTPLCQFKDRIHLAKSAEDARTFLATASSSLESYSISLERRDAIVARYEIEDDEMIKDILADKLRTMKSSDSEARINAHVAACKVVRAYTAWLESMFCESSRWSDLDEAQLGAKLMLVRNILNNNAQMFTDK